MGIISLARRDCEVEFACSQAKVRAVDPVVEGMALFKKLLQERQG